MRPERTAPVVLVLLVLLVAGCSRPSGPPPVALGTPCASCGMEVRDLGFACELRRGGAYRVYDSIECLLRERPAPGEATYVADYDSQGLHRADSLWIVKGRFPTPMGGGLAAFLSRAAADSIAARSHGQVGPWSEAMRLLVAEP